MRHTLWVGAVMLAVAPMAQAVLIGYSLSGDEQAVEMSNGLDADVTLDAYSDTIDLTPGVADTFLLNPGSVFLIQGSNALGSDSLSQTLTITSPASTPTSAEVEQSINIATFAANPPFANAEADAFLFSASPVVFELVGYTLTVTPLGGTRIGQTSTEFPISNSAEFLLTATAVPEPATMSAALVAGGLLLARRRRLDGEPPDSRRRSAVQ